jgi:hypothetical protein
MEINKMKSMINLQSMLMGATPLACLQLQCVPLASISEPFQVLFLLYGIMFLFIGRLFLFHTSVQAGYL